MIRVGFTVRQLQAAQRVLGAVARDTQAYPSQTPLLAEPNMLAIRGMKLRTALLDNDPLPDWYVRDDVQEMLREQIATNRPVFCESDVEATVVN